MPSEARRRWPFDPDPMTQRALARFNAKFTIAPSGCWEWQAFRMAYGYGQFGHRSEGRHRMRRAWVLVTHCIHGHEFTEANTWRNLKKNGKRECRACNARRARELRARRKVAA